MSKQLFFPQFDKLKKTDFGGSLTKGNPREARPISIKKPMHLVLRSDLAKGSFSFLVKSHAARIENVLKKSAKTQGVKLLRYANSGNHLHMIILPSSRKSYLKFIRIITGLIARIVLNAERGSAAAVKFWDSRPYTRIMEWGREFRVVCKYLLQNELEALGMIPYRTSKHINSS